MKARLVLLFLLGILGFVSARAEQMIFKGKPYDVKPAELDSCGVIAGDAVNMAAMFALSFAQSTGESTWRAACQASQHAKCAEADIKTAGVEMVFTTVRRFPTAGRSEACKAFREDCEKRCKDSKLYDDKTCLIECNQYETWNK